VVREEREREREERKRERDIERDIGRGLLSSAVRYLGYKHVVVRKRERERQREAAERGLLF
tara:strand:- start:271 stop:453 length:183 start_codon:yes stop_codon:yes gene_type:complete